MSRPRVQIMRVFCGCEGRFEGFRRDSPTLYLAKMEGFMRLAAILILLSGMVVTSGCVPVAIGAGGAIAADTIAEDRGGDLF